MNLIKNGLKFGILRNKLKEESTESTRKYKKVQEGIKGQKE